MVAEDDLRRSVMDRVMGLDFSQVSLMTSGDFQRYLDDREISIEEDDLEYLESVGLMQPIARLERPKAPSGSSQKYSGVILSTWALRRYLDDKLLQYPVEGDFRRWSELHDGFEDRVYPMYHRYQLNEIHRLTGTLEARVPAQRFGETLDLRKLATWRDAHHKSYSKLRLSIMRKTFLLIELETPYLPVVTSTFQMNLLDRESPKKWYRWKKDEFSAKEVLDGSDLSLSEVKDLRDTLAVWGTSLDPISYWYPLAKLASRNSLSRLKGKALLAQDFYEMVGILNLFLQDLTGEIQPDPDDVSDFSRGVWKGQWFGSPFSYTDPKIQQRIVQHYLRVQLPRAVILFEGETEETVIRALTEDLLFDIQSAGVELFNCQGQGGFGQSTVFTALHTWRGQNIRAFVILDRDANALQLAQEYKELKLVRDTDCKIWESDFEQDNFGIEAVCQVVNAMLAKRGVPGVSGEKVKEEINTTGDVLMKSIERVYGRSYKVGLFDLVKKVEIAKQLISPRLDDIRSQRSSTSYTPKLPIEHFLVHIFDSLLGLPAA